MSMLMLPNHISRRIKKKSPNSLPSGFRSIVEYSLVHHFRIMSLRQHQILLVIIALSPAGENEKRCYNSLNTFPIWSHNATSYMTIEWSVYFLITNNHTLVHNMNKVNMMMGIAIDIIIRE
uniref:Uncharacterized protein n=1 Tax=Cacopsylla melanoneura TaxID=428564 RepID=A0A8D8W184_9HEMI